MIIFVQQVNALIGQLRLCTVRGHFCVYTHTCTYLHTPMQERNETLVRITLSKSSQLGRYIGPTYKLLLWMTTYILLNPLSLKGYIYIANLQKGQSSSLLFLNKKQSADYWFNIWLPVIMKICQLAKKFPLQGQNFVIYICMELELGQRASNPVTLVSESNVTTSEHHFSRQYLLSRL